LDALIGGLTTEDAADAAQAEAAAGTTKVPLEQIQLNPHQPRKDFDADELAALQRSMQTHGLLQPVVVRPAGEGFQLVAGERRLRAAKECGWQEIPVHVVDFTDQQQFAAALVENIQRADLNPIEKAQGFAEYIKTYGLTHEDCARQTGLDRSTITNLVRLLELPPEVQDAVRIGQISNGHAKALLALEQPERQIAVCKEIITQGLSVRAVEAMTREVKPDELASAPSPAVRKTRHVQALQEELCQRLGTKVDIRLKAKDRGQIVIDFANNDDFERVVTVLSAGGHRS
jgi:ParB family chromosome partitioning protein